MTRSAPPERRGHQRVWRWLALLWLGYLAYPLTVALGYGEPRRTLGVLAVVAYGLGYGLFVAPVLPDYARFRRHLVWLLLALAVIGPPAFGEGWVVTSVFAGMTAAIVLPWRYVGLVLGGLFGYGLLGSWLLGWSGSVPVASVALTLALQFFITVSVGGLIRSNSELFAARIELAQLAVTEERLRFSRDLHDLLGHGLTVIVVKSELVRRLVEKDPARALDELADIERIARQSLVDVRETVSGYRELSLRAEIEGARDALGAAGVSCVVQPPEHPLPAPVEALLAWGVREGTTNILRHSQATRCSIRVAARQDTASLEVVDNGVGPAGYQVGSGLAGLAERLAAVGGRLVTEAAEGDGFRLCAEVPLERAL